MTANVIAQVHIVLNRKEEDLPDTARTHGWSIFDDPPMIKRDRAAQDET